MSEKDPSLIVLVYRTRQKDWSFPKGHVESGESDVEAANREVAEETGLTTRIIDTPLPPMEYDPPTGEHVVVHMFLMRSTDDSKLKPEFDGDQVLWVKADEIPDRLSYDSIKIYYASVFGIVMKTIEERKISSH